MTSSTDFRASANLLKLMGHPLRLKIVCGLLGEPANLSRIARDLEVPVSTLAQHLTVLRRGGILAEERHGVEVVFRVADDRIPAVLTALCAPRSARGKLPRWSWSDLSRESETAATTR